MNREIAQLAARRGNSAELAGSIPDVATVFHRCMQRFCVRKGSPDLAP